MPKAIDAARRSGLTMELLDSYRNYLRLLACASIDSEMQAKLDRSDLVQETLIKAHDRFDQFSGRTEQELAAWLRQILSRQLIDMTRRLRGATRDIHREMSMEQTLEASSLSLGGLITANGTSPSVSAQRRELAVVLADALSEMKPEYREVIMMKNIHDLTWQEIGNRMKRTPAAARMLWTRALVELRPAIENRL